MASKLASPWSRTPAWWRRDVVLDVGLAAAVFALSLLSLAGRAEADSRDLDLLGVILSAVASLPLVARRRAPLAAFATMAAASSTLNGLGYPPGPPIGATVALFFLALDPEGTRAPRWLTGATVAGFFVVHVVTAGISEEAFPTVPILFGALVWGGAVVIGDRVRQRRRRIADLEAQLRQAERDAERERRLAAAEERTRIARDLHDSAGHAINVILVQAGAARLLGKQDPERAQAALETIDEVARETLGEIDQLVRALREDELSEEEAEPVEPAPGLAALETLAERHRSAGLAVEVRTSGARRPLSPSLDQAAYRILQEALTNAARHGNGSAEIDIAFGPTSLDLSITNPSGPNQPSGDGHGIAGMRERAALLGGALETEAGAGVFRVRGQLPYGGDGR